MDLEELVRRLEQERRLEGKLELEVREAEELVRQKSRKLKQFRLKEMRETVSDLETALERAHTSLNQLTTCNHRLRHQVDTYRKDRLDYLTLQRSHSLHHTEAHHQAHFLRHQSSRALRQVDTLRRRISSLQHLHHDRSSSLQERSRHLEAEIREDIRRNKSYIRSIDEKKPEYTPNSACISTLLSKWVSKVSGLKSEISQYTAYISTLKDGFQVLNSTGSLDSVETTAQATISALSTERHMLHRLLALKDEEERLQNIHNSVNMRLNARKESIENEEKNAELQCEELKAEVKRKEKEVEWVEVRGKLVRDGVEDLGVILSEYCALLGEWTTVKVGISETVTVETVLEVVQQLEAGTTELAAWIDVVTRRKRMPWPLGRASKQVTPMAIGAWDAGESARPRTLQEFREAAGKSMLNQSLLYIYLAINAEGHRRPGSFGFGSTAQKAGFEVTAVNEYL